MLRSLLKKLIEILKKIFHPKPPAGTENVRLTRPGAFALSFAASADTGFFAVKSEQGVVTIHPNGTGVTLDYSSSFCNVSPCLSATDSYNTGHLTDLGAGANGIAGDLDLTGLSALVSVAVAEQEITSLTLVGCTSLTQISAYNCQMGSSEINAVLLQTDSNGARAGTLSITGNAAPTNAGVTAKASLISKGWFVDTD